MKELDEKTLEKIVSVFKKSVEISPLRTPTFEKNIWDTLDFNGLSANEIIDTDLKEITSIKSNTIVDKNFLKELKDAQNIINEKDKIRIAVQSLNDKILGLDRQIKDFENQKEEIKNIIEILGHFDHLLVTVK